MKKIIYFVKNGRPTGEDSKNLHAMTEDGTKVVFSNGSYERGFEDSCDSVYLADDFSHIEKWALMKGIEVLKPVKATSKTSRKQTKQV